MQLRYWTRGLSYLKNKVDRNRKRLYSSVIVLFAGWRSGCYLFERYWLEPLIFVDVASSLSESSFYRAQWHSNWMKSVERQYLQGFGLPLPYCSFFLRCCYK